MRLRQGRAAAEEAGIEFDEVRVAHRQRERPEVEELTGQRLGAGAGPRREVIHDSKRICEFIDHLTASEAAEPRLREAG